MKLKDFLAKFKSKDKLVSSITTQQSIPQPIPVPEEKNIDIKILQENNYFKIVVADYYKIQDYIEKMREIDKFGVEDLLTSAVIWNGRKQRVNKGSYYAFKHNKKLYNILVNDEQIRIDERTPIDEEIFDKTIVCYLDDRPYSYFRCMHDKNRSSYDTRYYSPNGVPFMELSEEEFFNDFNSIISNLTTFEKIDDIVDITKIKNITSFQGKVQLEDF